jgi:transcriptional regulator with XRE-family HTH domain
MKTKHKKRGPIKGSKLEGIKRSPIGQRIFSVRRSKGISQGELGKKAGLSLRAVSYYERESERLPATVLTKIAEALGVTPAYLLGESPLKQAVQDDMPFAMKKAFDKMRNLPKRDQKNILQMIDALELKSKVAADADRD